MHTRELYDLSGHVALVTGGSIGLGYQMAQGLAEAGANVVIGARSMERCETAAAKLADLGVRSMAVGLDVTNPADVRGAVEKAISAFGRIDILVNNAGINDLHAVAPEGLGAWNAIMKTNITGVYLCAGAVAAVMRQQRSGSIINISSIYGLLGVDRSLYVDDLDAFFEFPAYTASKGAVVNLTRDLAANWGRHGIRVNCICPATFVTDQNRHILVGKVLKKITRRTPLGRTGGDDDLKGVAVFLASAASKYITGQCLAVDGGWCAW